MGHWRLKNYDSFDFEGVGKEMSQKWGLKGNLGLVIMGDEKVLLEFELRAEAFWVLNRGRKLFASVVL